MRKPVFTMKTDEANTLLALLGRFDRDLKKSRTIDRSPRGVRNAAMSGLSLHLAIKEIARDICAELGEKLE